MSGALQVSALAGPGGPKRTALVPALLSLALLSCSSTPELVDPPLRVKSQDQAGSVHVSVIAHQPWDEIKKHLAVEFPITAETALQQAVPVSQQQVDRAVTALAFGLGLGLGQSGHGATDSVTLTANSTLNSGTSSTNQVESTTGKETIVTTAGTQTVEATNSGGESASSTDSSFSKPSDGSDAKFPALKDPASAATLSMALTAPGALDFDPVMKHQAAAALYQEIQMLNHSIEGAARRIGYRAHFVRLQVSLMPRSRRLPYDAYVNISFFASCVAADPKPDSAAEPASTCKAANMLTPADAGSANQLLPRAPVVIPLLVTDNLESELASRNVENIAQFAAGLSGVVQGIGLNAQAGQYSDRAQSMLGRSFNSLMTVGRVTDNTMRVRLGAMSQGIAGPRMVPRTHNVSLMILVPTDAHRITVTTKTQFVDPDTTEALPSRSSTSTEEEQMLAVARKYPEYCMLDSSGKLSKHFKRLHQIAFLGMQQEFQQALETASHENEGCFLDTDVWRSPFELPAGGKGEKKTDAIKAHELRKASYVWADMASLIPGSRFNHTGFDVAFPSGEQKKNICPQPQTAVLRDDGKSLTAILTQGVQLKAGDVVAALSMQRQGHPLRFTALDAKIADNSISLSFPSLSELNLADKMQDLKIELSGCAWPPESKGGKDAAPAPATAESDSGAAEEAGKPAGGQGVLKGAAKSESRHAMAPPPEYSAIYVFAGKKPEPDSRSQLRLSASQILVNEAGEGTVSLSIVRGTEKDAVYLVVRGADIADPARPGMLEAKATGLLVIGSGTTTLVLRNLAPGKPLHLSLIGENGKTIAAAASIAVVAAVTAKK